jgi:hypothetical protein
VGVSVAISRRSVVPIGSNSLSMMLFERSMTSTLDVPSGTMSERLGPVSKAARSAPARSATRASATATRVASVLANGRRSAPMPP